MSVGARPAAATDIVCHDFASDNHAGAHPEVLEALVAANEGHAPAYGGDAWTTSLQETIQAHFGQGARAYPVFNGTGANVLCLSLLGRSHEAVVCTAGAHINVDECGAPERLTGMKLLPVESEHGRLTASELGLWDAGRGVEHHSQPRIVSITQATELGTLYRPEQITAIARAAHARDMYVHVDGARIANAAASLGLSLGAMTTDLGVDAVSFGGTKNGLLFGEVAVLLGAAADETATLAPFARKQTMQLASKMRFISAQFEALYGGDLWLRSAEHANRMATLLGAGIEAMEGAELAEPSEANGVFARLPAAVIEGLLEALPGPLPFHVWDPSEGVVRWMCSWDTTPADVEGLLEATRLALAGART